VAEQETHAAELAAIETAHASGGVPRRDAVVVRGEGAYLYTEDGRSFLDFSSGHGWANVGHCHPVVTQAIHEQSTRLIALTESASNDQRALWFRDLTHRLESSYPPSDRGLLQRIIPCNSGTEGIEAALKVARLFTGRQEFVAFHRGFHGRTFGALSATAKAAFREPFAPLVPGFTHVAFNDAGAVAQAVSERTAGVIVEVVQGEGGVHVADRAFLDALREVCTASGALLVVDEIQTGLGRTGRWFAGEHFDLTPDILVLGKTLGGGIPMGATIWREQLGTIPAGSHGSTFGGGPLPCAAGRAVLKVMADESLPERASQLGARAVERLRAGAPRVVREIRGLGLMIGIELRSKVGPVLGRLMERGVWALPAGMNVLRLLPPLVIEESDLDRGLDVILRTLQDA
jgi:[amino-group carrier protein]-gamma-(L-lysyl/L-ornithyl)-L-glutamate aminotransferase